MLHGRTISINAHVKIIFVFLDTSDPKYKPPKKRKKSVPKDYAAEEAAAAAKKAKTYEDSRLYSQHPFPISILPDDVQRNVLAYFEIPSLGRVGSTSKSMLRMATSDEFWTAPLTDLLQKCFYGAFNLDFAHTDSLPYNQDDIPLALSVRPLQSTAMASWFHDWIQCHYQHRNANNRAEISEINEYMAFADNVILENATLSILLTASLEDIDEETRQKYKYKWLFQDVSLRTYYERAGQCYYEGQTQANYSHYEVMEDVNRCIYCGDKNWECRCKKYTKKFAREQAKRAEPGFEKLPRINLFR